VTRARPALLALGLALAALLAPPVARAQGDDDPSRAAWQQRLRDLRSELRQARTASAAAKASYSRMRSRNRLRGEAKAEVIEKVATTEKAVVAAEHKLEAFYEEARRAGVPPGWLRLPEGDPASPSP